MELTATNISADEASRIEVLPKNTVLISVNQEHGDLFDLKLNRTDPRVLTLRFNDITASIKDSEPPLVPITQEQTLKLLNFINLYKDANFLIHCAAGVSRSAAIALYIHLNHGHKLKEDFWKISKGPKWPNPFVLGRLFIERNRKI